MQTRTAGTHVRAFALSTLAALVIGLTQVASAQQVFLSFSGGSPGGSYNLMTTALAPLLTDALDNVRVSSEGSTGSPENVRRINSKETELALAFSSDLVMSWHGFAPYTREYRDTRVMAYVDANVGHMVVLANSDIQSVYDLVGKRVSLGPPGSGSATNIERYFRHLGIWDQIEPNAVFLGALDGSQALKDGHIDAYNWHVNIGNATYHDTASTHDIRLIDLHTPAVESGFYDAFPFYTHLVIPGGVYRSVDGPTDTFATPTYWIVHEDFDADLAYRLLQAAFTDESIARVHNAIGESARQNFGRETALLGVPIPLHEGAKRYWEDQGFDVPDVEVAPIEAP
jgi:uncharacterized protein